MVDFIDSKLEPFKTQVFRVQNFEYSFHRDITRDDILRLLEIKMQRILKYNKDKADEQIARKKAELAEIESPPAPMTPIFFFLFVFLPTHAAPRFATSTLSRRRRLWRPTRSSTSTAPRDS